VWAVCSYQLKCSVSPYYSDCPHYIDSGRWALPAEPASVLRVVDRLGSLQFDPLEVTGRNHDLVLAARIAGYRRSPGR
jgi:hypothetical protein